MPKIADGRFSECWGRDGRSDGHRTAPGSPLLRALTEEEKAALQHGQDQWLPTVCGQCPAGCGIMSESWTGGGQDRRFAGSSQQPRPDLPKSQSGPRSFMTLTASAGP